MLGPVITYELAKTIHESRLKEAEQARLLNSLKAASSPKLKKWLRGITTGDASPIQLDKVIHLIPLYAIWFRRRPPE